MCGPLWSGSVYLLFSCFVFSSPHPLHRYLLCTGLPELSHNWPRKSYSDFKTSLSITSHEALVDLRDRISSYFCAPTALRSFLFWHIIFMHLFIHLFTRGFIILGTVWVIIFGEHWLCARPSLNAKDRKMTKGTDLSLKALTNPQGWPPQRQIIPVQWVTGFVCPGERRCFLQEHGGSGFPASGLKSWRIINLLLCLPAGRVLLEGREGSMFISSL